jgi:hypothetical protein
VKWQKTPLLPKSPKIYGIIPSGKPLHENLASFWLFLAIYEGFLLVAHIRYSNYA